MWRTEKQGGKWSAEFVADGQIKIRDNRFVVVPGKGSGNASETAEAIFENLSSGRDKTTLRLINRSGFDMHYTPEKSSVPEMTNSKDILHASASSPYAESAHLLARTMYKARNAPDVAWGSEEKAPRY